MSRVRTSSSYWEAVALPMLLTGAGQGLAFAPMTSAGIAGVGAEDAGAASRLVNTFHQLGMALGLGLLIAASAHAGHNLTSPAAVLTAHVNTALATGSMLLALCLAVTLTLIVPVELSARRGRRATTVPAAAAAKPAPVAAAAARDWPARDEGIASCRS